MPWRPINSSLLIPSIEEFRSSFTYVFLPAARENCDTCSSFLNLCLDLKSCSISTRLDIDDFDTCLQCITNVSRISCFDNFQDAVNFVGHVGLLVPSHWVYLHINFNTLSSQAILTTDL